MNKVNINFETLYEILRLEKTREDIQELPSTFFDDVKEYIREKKKILGIAQKNLFSEEEIKRTKKQLSNIYKIIDELYNRRETKIVNLAMMKSDSIPQFPLSKEELNLFKKLKNILVENKKEILGNLHQIKKQTENHEISNNIKEKTISIRLNSDVPKFLGKEMQVYGPYSKNQIIELPEKIAEILIKQNLAIKYQKP